MPKVIVCHQSYGCDTGCCGHVVEVDGEQVGDFSFGHPYSNDNHRAFAEELVRAAGCDPADLDWENCVVLDE
jgi:hypothetical protein